MIINKNSITHHISHIHKSIIY